MDTQVTVKTGKNHRNGEKGQNLVEFAMVVPIFLILVFSIVDFGMGFHAWITVTNAAREGARIGAVGANFDDIRTRVATTSNGLLNPTEEDIRVRYVDLDNNGKIDRGDSVVVESDYEYQLITPLKAFLGVAFDSINFSSCTDMRLELRVLGAGNPNGGTGC